MDSNDARDLSASIRELAKAVDRNTQLLELLWENLPAKKRAELLGVGLHRERSGRKKQQIRRLAEGS